MSNFKFLKKYFNKLSILINNEKHFTKLIKVKDILLKTHKSKQNFNIWQWW